MTPTARLVIAFASLYVVWGSTYLAIKIAIQTLPPLLMAGVRFLLAGGILIAWLAVSGAATGITRDHWKSAAIVGVLLLLGGNGLVVWAQQTVPSGIAALLVGTTPFWMVLLGWLVQGQRRPSLITVGGLLLGFAGLSMLIKPGAVRVPGDAVDTLGAAIIVMATLCWATGSVVSPKLKQHPNPFVASSLQMLSGGAVLLLFAALHEEFPRLNLPAVSSTSWAAFVYLVLFGSIVGFSSYVYILKHASPAMASTYAYVNPVIAVLLGWSLGGESIGWRTAVAGGMVVTAVAIISTQRAKAPREARQVEGSTEAEATV